MEDQLQVTVNDQEMSGSLEETPRDTSEDLSQVNHDQIIQQLIKSGKAIFSVFEDPRKLKYTPLPRQKPIDYNRKQKSLEELSKKFINCFEGKQYNILELDKVTEQLGVERRRMYDIINILESLRVVVKCGKNKYQWKGLAQAIKTIEICQNSGPHSRIPTLKKEKSLQFLAGGFLNLFLHLKPAISLQHAIRQLIKCADHTVVRAKIRRLYDIVNVFKSLGLVKKVHLSNNKPGFQWTGTEYMKKIIKENQNSYLSTKQSNLTLNIQHQKVQNLQTNYVDQFSKFINDKIIKQGIKNDMEKTIDVIEPQSFQLFNSIKKYQSAFSFVRND